MEPIFQSQAEILADITHIMYRNIEILGQTNSQFESQLEITKNINKGLETSVNSMTEFNATLNNISETLAEIEKIEFKSDAELAVKIKKIFKDIKTGKTSFRSLENAYKRSRKEDQDAQRSLREAQRAQQTQSATSNNTQKLNKTWAEKIKDVWKKAKETCFFATELSSFVADLKEKYNEIKDKVKSGLSKLFGIIGSIPGVGQVVSFTAGVVSLVGGIAWNMMSTGFSILMSSFKMTMTLPFTIASRFVQIGHALRSKVVESLGNKIESFKTEYDLKDSIGQDLSDLGEKSKDLLIRFQNNKDRLVELFDYDNPEAMLDFAFESTKTVGIFGEAVSKSISGSVENVSYLKEAMSALGIGASELKYYALESFSSVTGLQDVLHENIQALSKYKNDTGKNFKLLSKEFHKLRLDIVQFGHLSAMELAEVSGEILKMKLSAEDVTGIFGKIGSFEDAANMSAKLFQSFGMTIDAFDMLSADDPVEVIKMLKEGLLNTGKSFGSMNRHEKALLKQITGLSDIALQTTFSYNNLGVSDEEFQEKLKENNPAVLMTESLKTMSSSIKSIIKILNFNSPFEALQKGFFAAASTNKEFADGALNISRAYEKLRLTMQNIPDSSITAITTPLNIILRRFNKYMTDGKLAELFASGANAVGDFFNDVYSEITETQTDNNIMDFTYMLQSLSKVNSEGSTNVYDTYSNNVISAVYNLIDSHNTEMTEILKKKNLLDEKGQLKNMTLSNATDVLMSVVSSSDEAFTKSAEEIIQRNLDIDNLTRDIRNIKDVEKTTKDKLVSKRGISRISERLFEGVSALLDKGKALFYPLFNLGKTIMGGIVKGAVIGTTAFAHILNGKINEADKILTEYTGKKSSKTGGSFILEVLGIKEGEFKTLTDNLNFEASKLASSSSDKLIPALQAVKNEMFSYLGTIFYTLKSLVYNMIKTTYEGMPDGIRKTALGVFLSEELRASEAEDVAAGITTENYKTFYENAQKKAGERKFGLGDNLFIDFTKLSRRRNKYSGDFFERLYEEGKISNDLFGGDDYLVFEELYSTVIDNEDVLKQLLLTQFENEGEKEFSIRFKKTQNLIAKIKDAINTVVNSSSRQPEIVDKLTDRFTREGYLFQLRSLMNNVDLKIKENKKFKTQQVQDMIIFDRDDEFELVASKENLKVRNELSEAANFLGDSVEEVKNVINKKNTLLRKDVFVKNNKKIILDLFDKLNSYISNVESMQKENIVEQKTVKFV